MSKLMDIIEKNSHKCSCCEHEHEHGNGHEQENCCEHDHEHEHSHGHGHEAEHERTVFHSFDIVLVVRLIAALGLFTLILLNLNYLIIN